MSPIHSPGHSPGLARTLPLLLGTAALWAALSTPVDAQRHVVSQNSYQVPLLFGNLEISDTVVQDGADSLNRFTMHRVRRPAGASRGTLLLLPSLGNRFEQYLTEETGDVTLSFAAVFARIGYDVWGYSPRSANVAAGACAGGLDCSAALDWTLQTVLDDVAYVRARIADASPGELPIVGGLSMGGTVALAAVNANPQDYAGVLAWDGALTTSDPAIRAHTLGFFQQLSGALDAGVAFDDQSLPFVKQISQLATVAPNDPFPIPGFPPGLTNQQAFVFVMSQPNPLAPSPRPGFISAAGDFMAGQFTYSDSARLQSNVAVFNDSIATGILREMYGSMAGVLPQYSDNLDAFTGKVLVFKAGQGFGSVMDELVTQLSSAEVTVRSNENYGHVDHFGSPFHWLVLELQIALWLETVCP